MKRTAALLTATGLLAVVAGCSAQPNYSRGTATTSPANGSADVAMDTPVDAAGDVAPAEPSAVSESPTPANTKAVELSPENAKIQFVGTHAGDKPDPRTGVFGEFQGQAEVDAETNALRSVSVEIQTESLSTPIEKLTNHLKSPDFFDVREHPTATFVSASIEPAGESAGQVNITGDLTLLGVTKSITFPATVEVHDDGVNLYADFVIDRTEFGMDYGLQNVNKEVALTVWVGDTEKTAGGVAEPAAQPAPEAEVPAEESAEEPTESPEAAAAEKPAEATAAEPDAESAENPADESAPAEEQNSSSADEPAQEGE